MGRLNNLNKKIRGINKVISISKIKKINLIKKNWILKGRRLLEMGSNPHSKGDVFSRSWEDFFEINKFNIINKMAINIQIREIKIIWIIIYIKDI